MDEWKYIGEALKYYTRDLQDKLPIEDLLLDIKNGNLISENEYQVINSMSSRKEKNNTFCKILKSKTDSRDFILFCQLLCLHSNDDAQYCGWNLRYQATHKG